MPFNGVYTAIISPFDHNGHLDEEGFSELVCRQVEHQIDGVVPLGTTGEAPTLNDNEKKRLISIARKHTPKETVLMVGTGSNSTAQTIASTLLAQELGADCALVVVPYYNKPTQEGLYLHYKTLAQATNLPLILYNPPHRTGQNLSNDTLKRLLEIPSIVGIKECSGNLTQMSETIEVVRQFRKEFAVFTGDDAFLLPMMAFGASGVISVVSNLVPAKMKELYQAALKGDFSLARELHYQLMPLFRAAFIETNPAPIKAAMNFCSLPAGECRLPLSALSQENMAKLQLVLADFMNEAVLSPASVLQN